HEQDSGDLAVWALASFFVRKHGSTFKQARTTMQSAPRWSNANFHAQTGLFTLCRWMKGKLEPLDVLVSGQFELTPPIVPSAFEGEQPARPPVMRVFTAHRLAAPTLMKLLHMDGVSGLTLFPGFGGVAQNVKERLWSGQEQRERHQ